MSHEPISPVPQRAPFGLMGVLADDGVRAQCHVCGKWFGHLGNHVARTHGMECDAYRRTFGLAATTGLIGPRLKERRALDSSRPEVIERLAVYQDNFKGHPGRMRVPTEESRRRKMLEANDIGRCRACGREMWVPKGYRDLDKLRHVTCGRAECLEAIRPVVYTDDWRDHISKARYMGKTAPVSQCVECGRSFEQRRLGRNHWSKRKTCSEECRLIGKSRRAKALGGVFKKSAEVA